MCCSVSALLVLRLPTLHKVYQRCSTWQQSQTGWGTGRCKLCLYFDAGEKLVHAWYQICSSLRGLATAYVRDLLPAVPPPVGCS